MNRLYDTARAAFARGQIDWVGDTITARLVRASAYTPDFAADQYLDDVPAFVTDGEEITNCTATAGVLDGDDVVFSSVTAGAAIDGVLIYRDTGNAATSQLIAWIDSGAGLPVTPDGTDITVSWDAGSLKILKL